MRTVLMELKLLQDYVMGNIVNTNIYCFQDTLDLYCNCGQHIETTIYLFLHCSNYSNQRKILFKKTSNIKNSLLNQKWCSYS